MKVIHLARKFLPPTASFIYNQIIHHKQFEPSIVYCEETESVFRQKLEKEYPAYCTVNSTLGWKLYKYFRQLTPSERKNLKRYIQSSGADILHVHYGVDALVYADIFKGLHIPVLVSFYGYDCTSFPNRFKGLGKTWLQKKLFENPRVTRYTAMSPDMKEDLLKLGCPEKKIIVHYHGSDPRPFFQERRYPEKDDIHLLIISSLTEKKGHLFLLEAFKYASAKTSKNLYLHIVGEGELRKKLEDYIEQEGIKNVHLHGAVDYGSKEHHNFLSRADIFVHPSITTGKGEKEGIPGALIEARSSGLPILATYHAGIPYIVEHDRTGLLCNENDVQELAKQIVRLADSAELREKIGKSGQQYTLDELDVVKKEDDLEQIYMDMIKVSDPVKFRNSQIVLS